MPTYSKSYTAWLARQTAKSEAKYGALGRSVANDPLAHIFCIESQIAPKPRDQFNGKTKLRYFQWRFFRELAELTSALSIPPGSRTPRQTTRVHDFTLAALGRAEAGAVAADPASAFHLIATAMRSFAEREADSEYREYALRLLSLPPFLLTPAQRVKNAERFENDKVRWVSEQRAGGGGPGPQARKAARVRSEEPSYGNSQGSEATFFEDAGEVNWNAENSESAGGDESTDFEDPNDDIEESTEANSFDGNPTAFESNMGDPWRSSSCDRAGAYESVFSDSYDTSHNDGMFTAYAEVVPGVEADSSGNWSPV